ncbi:MAG TPA: prolipoprotein diacylglyceryl transferase [Candidatus Hydrogenedentes bacterium]|nr:prolipoprotein diacylglyceryl transferase [Candidatus Hydrogenedentota bacterium]HPG70024.1 prolipoprotein diacylglyceryl transferase [Candidatus Hydrogenedentota bacterium]
MIAVGFLTALFLSQREAARRGMDPQRITEMWFWALLLGIAGTRVLHIVMFPSAYSLRDPMGWIALWRGGLVFQGALPTSILYIWYHCRKRGTPFMEVADIVTPYLPLAHAFGRIGCFLNGCCYGVRTDLPWGIPFRRVPWDLSKPPTGSPCYLDHCQRFAELSLKTDHWSYPVHPTQLYSAAMLTGICLLLLYIRKRHNPYPGAVLPLYFVFYGVGRFGMEFLRGDHNPTHFGVLSDQQIISVLLVIAGMAAFLVLRRYHTGAREAG